MTECAPAAHSSSASEEQQPQGMGRMGRCQGHLMMRTGAALIRPATSFMGAPHWLYAIAQWCSGGLVYLACASLIWYKEKHSTPYF